MSGGGRERKGLRAEREKERGEKVKEKERKDEWKIDF